MRYEKNFEIYYILAPVIFQISSKYICALWNAKIIKETKISCPIRVENDLSEQ